MRKEYEFCTRNSTSAKLLHWDIEGSDYDIIAYRIIPEPEKFCKPYPPSPMTLPLSFCRICAQEIKSQLQKCKGEPVRADKPTPKQTLVNFGLEKYGALKLRGLEADILLNLISEYLETRLK